MVKDSTVRLMSLPRDYQRMKTKKGKIASWEDARRDDDRAGVYEWWYFDMLLDDGSAVVVHFNTKDNQTIQKSGTIPSVVVKITTPDGREFKDNVVLPATAASFAQDHCGVHFGPHFLEGDLHTYQIHVAPTGGVNGQDGAGGTGSAANVAVDLTLTSTAQPWRPGAGGFTFGQDEAGYFTWLCAVPRGTVQGTITYDGHDHLVTGTGYHDHQWGNMAHNKTWDHWLWGRQDFGDYALLVFDIGTQKAYQHQRLPMMFLEDNAGNLIMEDLQTPGCQFIQEYREKLSGKLYPKKIKYTFTQGQKHLTYVIDQQTELESRDAFASVPALLKPLLKLKGLHPSTTRNRATGTMTFSDGTHTLTRSGDMIYEFVYMGMTVKDQMTSD